MAYWKNKEAAALLIRHRDGDAAATDELGAMVLTLAQELCCWRYGKMPFPYSIDFEAVVADVVVEIWQRLHKLDPTKNLHAYITRIGINAIARHITDQARFTARAMHASFDPKMSPEERWVLARFLATDLALEKEEK